jgi:hypothetical protein
VEVVAPQSQGGTIAGSLWLMSTPAQASVFLDGQLVGKTPIAIPDLSEGAHAVRLELSGYRGWTSEVHIRSNRRERVIVTLEPASNP